MARYAPKAWPSPGSVIDTSYEALDRMARQPVKEPQYQWGAPSGNRSLDEPQLATRPPDDLGLTRPDAARVTGRDVWLVHPWSLGALPAALPPDMVVIGVFVADFHRAWPWSERRWRFVCRRMAELTPQRWYGNAAAIGTALADARRVRSIVEPHLTPWLARLWMKPVTASQAAHNAAQGRHAGRYVRVDDGSHGQASADVPRAMTWAREPTPRVKSVGVVESSISTPRSNGVPV